MKGIETGIVMVGGGVPKNCSLLRDEMKGIETEPFGYFPNQQE